MVSRGLWLGRRLAQWGALIGLLLVLVGLPVIAAEPDLTAILREIDRQSNFNNSDFAAVMTLVIQDPEKGLEKIVARQFRRDREEKFLLLIQDPPAKRGQGYLMDGDNLWFYDPESRKFSHTSIKESFAGSDARSADFQRSSLAEDYRVTGYSRDKLGRYDVYVIDLATKNNEVAYPYLKLWVTTDTHLVLKSESYSLSKRLMRTALFPSYTKVDNTYVPAQMVFIDELVKGRKTQVTLTQISLQKLPDSVFTKAFVERANR